MKEKDLQNIVGGICFILICLIVLGLALFPKYCAHAQTINPGDTFNYSGSVKCNNCPAPPACNSCCAPCPACPTPAPTPMPNLCLHHNPLLCRHLSPQG